MEVIGDHIGFSDASEIEIFVAASSDFYVENPFEDALETVKEAMKYSYDELKARHVAEHKALFNRSNITLSTKEDNRSTPERLKEIQDGARDGGILELFYNVGKYILINSSREGSQPANLQGIWNAAFAAPWECNYTLNINLECNYWIAESAGLPECHMPLFDLIDRMVPNGEKTAKKVYGCDGFVCHHTTNLWGDTSIEGNSFPSSVWPMGGAWLTLHMWDHYLYTGDVDFLRNRAFPIMKKNAIFFSQYLFEDKDGYYITGPSLSPENPYKSKTQNGYVAKHANGPEIDNQIIRAVLKSLLSAYDILGIDEPERKTYEELLQKIHTPRVNKNGAILEWNEDFEENDKEHRHLSHLFALYPYYDIDLEKTPHLAAAAEKTLDIRGGNEKGVPKLVVAWSDAWAAACYAKLGKPEKAIEHIYTVMKENTASMLSRINMGPSFCVFQMDGNMTSAAAITEMLLQSDEERIKLLPALSEEMQDGSFNSLVARGGFAINAKWQGGRATKASVTSKLGGVCRIKADGLVGVDTSYEREGEYIVFNTEKGKKYELQF
jgi:alpha-L-fucosidase 2